MSKIVGQNLVREIRDQFAVFSSGDYHRVFLWDDGHGYPGEGGEILPIDMIPRPFCLVELGGSRAEALTMAAATQTVADEYTVLVHVFCRPPEDAPYEFDTLPDEVKFFLAGREIEFLDHDQQPPAPWGTASAEDLTVTRSKGRGIAEPLFRYRATLRMRFTFFRVK